MSLLTYHHIHTRFIVQFVFPFLNSLGITRTTLVVIVTREMINEKRIFTMSNFRDEL